MNNYDETSIQKILGKGNKRLLKRLRKQYLKEAKFKNK